MDKKVMKEMTFMGYRRPDGRVGIRFNPSGQRMCF